MLLTAIILIYSTVIQAKPWIFGHSPEYRLPDNCSPSNYKLHLSFPETIFTGKTSTYEGTVVITFNCSTDTSNLRLHASKEYLTIRSLEIDGQEIDAANYTIEQPIEQLRINTPWDIVAGNTSKLAIYFNGEVAERNVGLYRKSYEEHNETLYFVTTKFEAIYARTMFPCFDEPLFRATFDVSVTYPNMIKAYFNTEQIKSEGGLGNVTDTFMTTPSMPTYLLALMLSNFERTTDIRYRIIARSSVLDDCLYARENGMSILTAYENFTGFRYSDMIKGKLDALIVPDYVIGGMEHWGMISFSEDLLLYNQQEDSILKEEEVFTVLVHEFAHQWFGDLVSIEWWSENYLKEGLAQYFQYFMTHELHPEWELDKKFVLEMVHLSMRSDMIPAGSAINSDVSSAYEVSLKLGGLTYDKGATIFNMVKHIMGETNFKNGLRQYINQKQFKSVTAASLWDALDDHVFHDVSHLPISDLNNVMNNWVGLPGYPIIYVKRQGNDVILSQQRFLKKDEEESSKWYVPITHTVSTQEDKFRTTTPDKWLTPEKDLMIVFADDWKWIILNTNATGYYRIDYEESIWEGIKEALSKEDFDGIPELNRVQIIDDLFSFAHLDKIPYSKVFRIIEFLSNDTSYYSWKTAFGHFETLQKRALSPVVRNAIMANVLKMSKSFYNTVPLTDIRDKDHMYLTKQLLAAEVACKMGNENCVSEVMVKFKNFTETKVRPDKNLKDLIYCNGMRYSNESKAWDFLWNMYKDAMTSKEKETALTALGCGREQNLLKMYLLKALEDKDVVNEDYEFFFGKSFENNPENVDVALSILLENYNTILERFKGKSAWRSQIYDVVEWLTTDEQIKKLEVFRNSGMISEVDMDIVTEAINRVKDKIKQSEKDNHDIVQYFGLSSGTVYLRCSIVFLVVCMISLNLL